uniref:Hpt domain-containing protein n=1 Tax=Dokdonella sp. TaxID=2291710 RepID=UPI002620A1A9
MKLHDDGEFTTLNWIKPALDATMTHAREALEQYVESPDDLAPMRECVALLHQVQGTLRMVELYGAAMVVENMERLADGIVDDSVRQREEAYSVLMRGMVQLPDYLERLQSGHKDIPIVLLPLLNDLRACRGEGLLSESALFSPDLSIALPGSASGAPRPLAPAERRTQALRLRLAFQAALLKWFRDETAGEHLDRLVDVLDRIGRISHADGARRLWWVAAGTIEAVRGGGVDSSVAVKLLLGRVDREINRFATDGDAGFDAAPPRELTKNLLYYIAHSATDGAGMRGPRCSEITRLYRLDTLLPTAVELQHAQGSMTGRNKNLLGTVSSAIKEDLLRVKEALDIFLRSHGGDPGELSAQVDVLRRVGDTLGMLGLGVPRRVVDEQRDVIEEMAARQRPVDEGALLDVAGALLYVEASLDDHIERLGDSPDGGSGESEGLELPQAEVRRILDALMREASVNIVQAKQDIIAFIESPWDHERVTQIPRLLEEIAGALRMLTLPDAAELMAALVRFVEVELLAHRRVPTTEQMDKLADAFAAVEYYLEATREQRRHRDRILDIARDSLQALGYWPLANAPAKPQSEVPAVTDLHAIVSFGADTRARHFDAAPTPGIEVMPGDDLRDLVIGEAVSIDLPEHEIAGLRFAETDAAGGAAADWIEVEEEVEEEVPVDDEPLPGFQVAVGEEIDDSIREIFVEEVEEEIANLRQQLPAWKRDVDNLDELKSVRRSFHTLKGSGRLVGALALGEFSWKIENLLNRVLDGSLRPDHHVVELVDEAIAVVPSLLAALRGERVGAARVHALGDVAERLSAGEVATLPAADAATRVVRRLVKRRVPVAPVEPPDPQAAPTADFSFADAHGAAVDELVAGPLPNVDPVLFDILQSEVATHLATIEDYLVRCEAGPVRASEPLMRAVHTLNGAIAMVEIPTVGNVLSPLESYVNRLRSAAVPPDVHGLSALRETVALTREVMQRLDARRPDLPESTDLVARVVALRDALPEPEAALLYDFGADLAEPAADEPPATEEGVSATPTAERDPGVESLSWTSLAEDGAEELDLDRMLLGSGIEAERAHHGLGAEDDADELDFDRVLREAEVEAERARHELDFTGATEADSVEADDSLVLLDEDDSPVAGFDVDPEDLSSLIDTRTLDAGPLGGDAAEGSDILDRLVVEELADEAAFEERALLETDGTLERDPEVDPYVAAAFDTPGSLHADSPLVEPPAAAWEPAQEDIHVAETPVASSE